MFSNELLSHVLRAPNRQNLTACLFESEFMVKTRLVDCLDTVKIGNTKKIKERRINKGKKCNV